MTEKYAVIGVEFGPTQHLVQLADWESRLLEKARLLRQSGKSTTLTVLFDGELIRFWVGQPAGASKEA